MDRFEGAGNEFDQEAGRLLEELNEHGELYDDGDNRVSRVGAFERGDVEEQEPCRKDQSAERECREESRGGYDDNEEDYCGGRGEEETRDGGEREASGGGGGREDPRVAFGIYSDNNARNDPSAADVGRDPLAGHTNLVNQGQQKKNNGTSKGASQVNANVITNFGNNILKVCQGLTSSVREYYRMSQLDQMRVWDDLVGYQGQRKVFVNGKELAGFHEELEPQHVVEEALHQLPLELQRMPASHDATALNMALSRAPNYVLERSFLLKFLRAEKFDIFATAVRMCRHFEIKLELFGEDLLCREIILSDLDDNDMASFESGYFQLLQEGDYSHRPVFFYYKAVTGCYKKKENLVRAFWYFANRVSMDENVQQTGVCNIVYNNGGFPPGGMDYEKSKMVSQAFRAIPVRFNNFFVCLDDKPWLTVVETFAIMITRFLRVRLRMVRGTHREVVEKLISVGLPAHGLPVDDNSNLLVENHLNWIREQRKAEKQEALNRMTMTSTTSLAIGTMPSMLSSPFDNSGLAKRFSSPLSNIGINGFAAVNHERNARARVS